MLLASNAQARLPTVTLYVSQLISHLCTHCAAPPVSQADASFVELRRVVPVHAIAWLATRLAGGRMLLLVAAGGCGCLLAHDGD